VTFVAIEEQQLVLCALLTYSHRQLRKNIACCTTKLLQRICVPVATEPMQVVTQSARYFCRILSKIFSFSTDLHKSTQYQISRKSVKWDKSWYTRTNLQRNRQKERQKYGRTDRWTWRSFWSTCWVKSRVETSPEIEATNTTTSCECAHHSGPQNNVHQMTEFDDTCYD
jgi:hypothetical protein